MDPLSAAILGVVEGLTEYLPVSSTGHLIIAGHFLHLEDETSKSFEIVIQLGAILAVLIHYRRLLSERAVGLFRGRQESKNLALALLIGFVPAGVAGFLFRKAIKAQLFYVRPVAAALVVGGVLMILVDRWRRRSPDSGLVGLEHIGMGRAAVIGLGQCFALWPGASRSMCTIVAGQLAGLSTSTAAEFSFLLALPTLGAATVYELWKARGLLVAGGQELQLGIGLVVSFGVAWGVIAAFLKYLRQRGLSPFGWYRILLGAILLWVLGSALGTDLPS